MLHMQRELLRIETEIAAVRRHFEFTCRQGGWDPYTNGYITPVALDVAARAIGEASEAASKWLCCQVIGLYGSDTTTYEHLRQARETPPPSRETA